MQTYKTEVKKYEPSADTSDGIVAYGWTTGALMAKILESSPKLDRASVMETARTLTNVTGIGLQLPGSNWTTSKSDWVLGETFQLVKYDATAQHSVPVGPVVEDNGKTASLSPPVLLTQ